MARLYMAWGTICGWSETGYWGEMGVGNLMVLWIYIYKTINKAEPAHSKEFTTSDPSRGWMETLWVAYIMITISHAQCCLEPRGGKRKEKKENYCMITKFGLRTHDFSRQRLLRAVSGNIATFTFFCLALKNWSLGIHCTACHAMHHRMWIIEISSGFFLFATNYIIISSIIKGHVCYSVTMLERWQMP